MARLIDADALYDALERRYRVSGGIEHRCERDLLDLICAAETVDAVEVVRCRYCKRCFKHTTKRNKQTMWLCMRDEMEVCVRPDDFCSYGERKDGEGNG